MQFDSTTLERFWAKVNKPSNDDCWEWTASKKPDGYGRFMINPVQHTAHRVSWLIRYGEIPPGQHVLHKCDNRACVNPIHLFLGSHAQNMADMREKGRAVGHPGQLNPRARLTRTDVIEARKIYDNAACKYGLIKKLSQRFSIPRSTMTKVVTRVTWKHLD